MRHHERLRLNFNDRNTEFFYSSEKIGSLSEFLENSEITLTGSKWRREPFLLLRSPGHDVVVLALFGTLVDNVVGIVSVVGLVPLSDTSVGTLGVSPQGRVCLVLGFHLWSPPGRGVVVLSLFGTPVDNVVGILFVVELVLVFGISVGTLLISLQAHAGLPSFLLTAHIAERSSFDIEVAAQEVCPEPDIASSNSRAHASGLVPEGFDHRIEMRGTKSTKRETKA
ncbi:hypothetical protein HAX54_000518 [Datura stramonium]|uniref:Uncharacterized protein n=1 Tax=Datura stramonium TaxID=4076 RepID=A0ABS8WSE8_DATST|nr:hypothetical protein [Datura stramonium]